MTLASVFLICSIAVWANEFGARESQEESALERKWTSQLELDEPKKVAYKSPIQRVIALLNEMNAQLLKEAENESEMYDKQVCWCETNEKAKTRAIADAETQDTELSSEIESRSARFGVVETEIAALKKQIAADTASLERATAIRERGGGAFRGEENDLVQSITNLKNAIAILSKHQGGDSNVISGAALLQMDAPVVSSLRTVIDNAAFKLDLLQAGKIKRRGMALVSVDIETRHVMGERRQLDDLLRKALSMQGEVAQEALPLKFAQRTLELAVRQQQSTRKAGGFLQAEETQPLYESYSSRSNAIFGVLTQMLDEFQKDLSVAQKDELQAIADFKAVAAAKKKAITVGKEKLDALQGESAENSKALSDAKENLQIAREQRSADVEFLRNLRVTCQNLEQEWSVRSKTRAEETAAVAEALAIITEDDHREMLFKTITFLQSDSSLEMSAEMKARRARTVSFLRKVTKDPDFETDDLLAAWNRRARKPVPGSHLSTLAVSVELDSFTKVKKMMDNMVVDLKKQQAEESEFKSTCITEFDDNEKETFDKTETKEDLEAKLAKLDSLMKRLSEEIADAQAQTADAQEGIKKAGEAREGENSLFQSTVADQRATQNILAKALKRLRVFYKGEKGGAVGGGAQFVQQTPPVQFTKYAHNKGASPVIGLIQQIVEDSKKTESEAIQGETTAQADYEKFVKDSNTLIAQQSNAVTQKTKEVAAAKLATEEAKSSHDSTVEELNMLAESLAGLNGKCNWLLKNFDLRQSARLKEIEAIQQAKAFLSGQRTE